MTTTGPYTQSLNRTHMFSFVDYRGKSNIVNCPSGNSIMNHIEKHPQLTKFKKIVNISGFGAQLAQRGANFTLFAPLDQHLKQSHDFFNNMDIGMARSILKTSLMDKKIDSSLLKSSPVSYYSTKNPYMRMYVTNILGRTEINQTASIIKFDIPADNGIIHLVDNILIPSDNTFIN